jgi:hypothetical protein
MHKNLENPGQGYMNIARIDVNHRDYHKSYEQKDKDRQIAATPPEILGTKAFSGNLLLRLLSLTHNI